MNKESVLLNEGLLASPDEEPILEFLDDDPLGLFGIGGCDIKNCLKRVIK